MGTPPWRGESMEADIRGRVERCLGRRPVAWRAAFGGYTPAERWVVRLSDGTGAFVKIATSDETAGWLREEAWAYGQLRGDFMPELLGWDDEGERPLLVIEDLSGADWRTEWTPARVDAVLQALESLAASPVPEGTKPMSDWLETLKGWRAIQKDPEPFLALGLADAAWLDEVLPVLVAAEDGASFEGEDLAHFDVRSDNICFKGARAVLVDWNFTCVGNGRMDVAAWLPSLHEEGGPSPMEIMPGEIELAALIGGFFASRAGLPIIPHAPRVRQVQMRQLSTALPWAVAALGLPEPRRPSLSGAAC